MSEKTNDREAKNDGLLTLYNLIRQQVDAENTLYNQRIHWLILMQSFLFATLGILVEGSVQKENGKIDGLILAFIILVALVGIGVSLICWRLLTNAVSVIENVREIWDRRTRSASPEIDCLVCTFEPHPVGGKGEMKHDYVLR